MQYQRGSRSHGDAQKKSMSPRVPGRGETKFGVKFQTGFGGKTSNAAVMAAKLGAKVAMIGRLGQDENGAAYMDNYRSLDVDVTNVTIDKDNARYISKKSGSGFAEKSRNSIFPGNPISQFLAGG